MLKKTKTRTKMHHRMYRGLGSFLASLAILFSCLGLALSSVVPLSAFYLESGRRLNKSFATGTTVMLRDMAGSYLADAMWIEPSILNVSYREFEEGFNVTVWANVSQSSTVWQFALRFDAAYLSISRYGLTDPSGSKSSFFSGFTNVPASRLDNDIVYYFEIIDDGAVCPAGSGSLCWIEFKQVAPTNKTTLSLETADSFILNADLNEIPLSYYSTVVDVSLIGDINGDGVVDMRDVGYVARRFMCVPSDPLWDPVADINGDGKIDMRDIGTVARHFMEHYP